MDKYPLITTLKERKWKEGLLNNEKVKTLFEKLASEASRENIPLASITGHENVILACAELEHINVRFGKGETFLHWAASYEPAYAIPTTKVLVLLLLGADPNIQDDLGRTPLHWAINHDCSDIAEDHELHYDRTSKANAVNVVTQLLSYNASPNIVDIYGASPFCHALWSKCFYIADMLRPLTNEHLQRPPRFLLEENENVKSIRCSYVDKWISENASNVTKNTERLQRLLSSPGVGLLQHMDEVEQQKDQVMAFFKRLSTIVAKEDHLLEFIPILAGSMAEGTKCQKPDEQDIILRLFKFEDVSIPEESEYAPDGVITLKFTGNESKANEYQQYILDGYLNREEILNSLITKLERELSLVSNWSGKEYLNIYPSHYPTAELKKAIDVGDIGNLTFIWHGHFYKQISLSIDIVPAIIIKNWKPENATKVDPTGGAIPDETFLILRAFIEHFEYDLEIHGELNTASETTGMEPADIDILNGKDWESGSDCMSDKSDEENDKEAVNSTSYFYNTYVVRNVREVTGYSIPTIKRLIRKGDATLNEMYGQPEPGNKEKTAEEDFNILHPCKKSRRSDEYVIDSDAPGVTEEYEENRDVRKYSSAKSAINCNMPSTSTEHLNCKSLPTFQDNFYDSTNKSDTGKKKNEGIHETSNREYNSDDAYACNINILKAFEKCSGNDDAECDKDERTSTEYGNVEDEEIYYQEFIKNVSDKSGYEAFADIFDTQKHYFVSELMFNDDGSNEDSTDLDDFEDDPPREDMGFKISYSKWENETMATFPSAIKTAYMLSKILVSFVPRIRIPLNRGVSKMKGYSSVKDVFSYLLKMALFHAVRKRKDYATTKPTTEAQADQGQNSNTGNNPSIVEQIIYSRTGGHSEPDTKSSMHLFSSTEIHEVAFWVDNLFSEIETSAETGYLGAYFDEKFNILDRISTSGKQKGNPYPALLYLRKHCKMIRALVRVVEKMNTETATNS